MKIVPWIWPVLLISMIYKCYADSQLSHQDIRGPLLRYEHPHLVNIDTFPATDKFRLVIQAYNQIFYLHMQPNEHLLHQESRATVYRDGKVIDNIQLNDMRAYKGRVLSRDASDDIMLHGIQSQHWQPFNDEADGDLGWARLSFHAHEVSSLVKSEDMEFDGVWTQDGQTYNVRTVDSYLQSRRPYDVDLQLHRLAVRPRMLIYRESDYAPASQISSTYANITGQHSCGTDNTHHSRHGGADRLFQERLLQFQQSDALDQPVLRKRSGNGCPGALKVLYMGVAADCSYVNNYGGQDGALKQIVSDFNQASKLYESTFNIALGLVSVNLQTTCDQSNSKQWNQQCTQAYSIETRLSDFSYWRGQQSDTYGLWHLMTQCSSGVVVGISWLNSVCSTQVSTQAGSDGRTEYVTGTGVSSITPSEWIVVAHEIGHQFGAVHDCTSQLCPACPGRSCQCCPCSGTCDCNAQYIMNPTEQTATQAFSPCSVSTICSKYPVLGTCLSDPGAQTIITGNECGNGVKEPGEDCDCGAPDGPACMKDTCCNAATCKYAASAKCDDLNDLCCTSCQPKPAQTVCRASTSSCDKTMVCDGSSGICPQQIYTPDLTQCQVTDGSQGQCAKGQCTSRDYQCKIRGSNSGVTITGQCPGYSNQCQLYCATDTSTCLAIAGFFSDGTACGQSGTCQKGTCQQSGWSSFIGWIQDHIVIAIILFIIVGMFVLCCLWSLFTRVTRSRNAGNARVYPQGNNQPRRYVDYGNGGGGGQGVLGGQQQQQQQPPLPPRDNWVNPDAYNGAGYRDERALPPLPPATSYNLRSAVTNLSSGGNSSPAKRTSKVARRLPSSSTAVA